MLKNKRMHCKVCESAGKEVSQVRSHNPKNREGITVCPTLLSQECRKCGKKGHTLKYCSKRVVDDRVDVKKVEKVNKKAAKILLASFDALYESSDEEEVVEKVKYMDALLKPSPRLEVKPLKVVEKVVVKINWATAETDSEGDESESDM